MFGIHVYDCKTGTIIFTLVYTVFIKFRKTIYM